MEILDEIDTARVRALREAGEFFWLKLTDPSDGDLRTLAELITIHPLALEDTSEFGQRAKLDDYPKSALFVGYGAEAGDGSHARLVEVHLHISAEALVTVSRRTLAALGTATRRVEAQSEPHPYSAVHAVLDTLADSLLDALEGFDDDIDRLQEAVAEAPTTAHRQRIFALRRHLTELRRVVVPQRDVLGSADELLDVVPGARADGARELLRDVHDHLNRAAGLVDSYREQLASLLDLYLTEVSTRMNEVMKRLTFMATVFLPLTFFSGFFGMNFGWFEEQISPLWTFLAFGIGVPLASVAAVAVYLRRTSARTPS